MTVAAAGRPAILKVRLRDADTATVKRSDGTTVAAMSPTFDGTWSTIALNPTQIGGEPDQLVVEWKAPAGQVRTTVDVVSHRFIEREDVREVIGDNPVKDAKIDSAIDWFEDLTFSHCGVAFHRRFAVAKGCGPFVQVYPHDVQVRWAKGPGGELDVDRLYADGRVLFGLPVDRKVQFGYTHGHEETPTILKEAALTAVVDMVRSGGERRVTRKFAETDANGFTSAISRASTKYRTGIDVVDSVLNDLTEHEPAVM